MPRYLAQVQTHTRYSQSIKNSVKPFKGVYACDTYIIPLEASTDEEAKEIIKCEIAKSDSRRVEFPSGLGDCRIDGDKNLEWLYDLIQYHWDKLELRDAIISKMALAYHKEIIPVESMRKNLIGKQILPLIEEFDGANS